jgi:hypothetical protein
MAKRAAEARRFSARLTPLVMSQLRTHPGRSSELTSSATQSDVSKCAGRRLRPLLTETA